MQGIGKEKKKRWQRPGIKKVNRNVSSDIHFREHLQSRPGPVAITK